MLRDVEFFKSRMAKIQGGDTVGEDLMQTVREKAIQADRITEQRDVNDDDEKAEK